MEIENQMCIHNCKKRFKESLIGINTKLEYEVASLALVVQPLVME